MFNIDGYIDKTLIDVLLNENCEDLQFVELKKCIMLMNKYKDRIVLDCDLAAEFYQSIKKSGSVISTRFEDLINKGIVSFGEVDFANIYEVVAKDADSLNTCLLTLDENKDNKNYINDYYTLELVCRKLLKFENQTDFFPMAERCFSNSIFSDEVEPAMSRVNRQQFDEDKKDYVEHLGCLNDDGIRIWYSNECLNDDFFTTKFKSETGIINTTEKERKIANRRYFKFDTEVTENNKTIIIKEKIRCEKHTKIERYGRTSQRIHFKFLDNEDMKKVLIGYVGNHILKDNKQYVND